MMVCRSLELFTKKSSFISFSLLRELDRSNLMNFVQMNKKCSSEHIIYCVNKCE